MSAGLASGARPEAPVIPQDIDAEQAVLGSMMLEAGATSRALAILSAADFYLEDHQAIAAAIEACYGRQEPTDLVTVSAELRRTGKLEQVGGGAYLTALLSTVPTAAHVVRYATIVREKSVLRELMRRAAAIQRKAQSNPDDVGKMLAEAGESLTELYRTSVAGAFLQSPLQRFASDTERFWRQLIADAPAVSSARFGIRRLDRDMGGLEAQRFVVIKGDTKHGKSQLTRQIVLTSARNFSADSSGRVAVMFILEEGYWPWRCKALAWLSGLDSMPLLIPGWGKRYLQGDPQREKLLSQAEGEWAALPLRVTDRVHDLTQIVASCRALAAEVPIGLVAIDYFQLIEGGDSEAHSEEQALAARAKRLQRLADELECPVVCPSQITIDRDTRRANTKGARAIEHNASMVIEWRREEEAGEFVDRGHIGCLVSRNTPGFRPLGLVTDRRSGRFWDPEEKAELDALERQARGY